LWVRIPPPWYFLPPPHLYEAGSFFVSQGIVQQKCTKCNKCGNCNKCGSCGKCKNCNKFCNKFGTASVLSFADV